MNLVRLVVAGKGERDEPKPVGIDGLWDEPCPGEVGDRVGKAKRTNLVEEASVDLDPNVKKLATMQALHVSCFQLYGTCSLLTVKSKHYTMCLPGMDATERPSLHWTTGVRYRPSERGVSQHSRSQSALK